MFARCTLALSVLAAAGCVQETGLSSFETDDVWYQAESNEIDILFVVDDSCSMAEEQGILADGMLDFANELDVSGTDFHLGVITTSFDYDDPDRGRLVGTPAYLTPEDDYVREFAERVHVGIDGSDKEKGLEAAIHALSVDMQNTLNLGFIRVAAKLLVVFVSDEDDCSDYGTLEGTAPSACYLRGDDLMPLEAAVGLLRLSKSDDNMITVGAIVGPESGRCQDSHWGRRYQEVVRQMGGRNGNICDSDWGSLMYDLGLNASGVVESFRLGHAAQLGTLEVYVDEERVDEDRLNGWTYEPTTWYLAFHGASVPPRGSQIRAHYTVAPGDQPSL